MQPLVSPVDHESRHNSYRADDEVPSESTPLLNSRFPASDREERNSHTTVVVSMLLFILLAGVIIGIYLLVEQSHEENNLPPVETALQLVGNMQWDASNHTRLLSLAPFRAKHVIAVQTDTPPCWAIKPCRLLLTQMQERIVGDVLPYSFLVSSNGLTFEALGWRRPTPMFPEYSNSSLVLAFIGNFTETSPTNIQIEEAKRFFDESVSQQCLDPDFDIIGKNTTLPAKHLFRSLQKLKQWNNYLSDSS